MNIVQSRRFGRIAKSVLPLFYHRYFVAEFYDLDHLSAPYSIVKIGDIIPEEY